MFSLSGGRLTQRLRMDSFAAVLSQEIGWFDRFNFFLHFIEFYLIFVQRFENSTGSVCARLSSDAAKVQGATGARVGTVLQVKIEIKKYSIKHSSRELQAC